MGSCSTKPKTTDFQGTESSYTETFQKESQKNIVDQQLKIEAASCEANYIKDEEEYIEGRAESQNKATAIFSSQSAALSYERPKTHGYRQHLQNFLLELQLKPLARINTRCKQKNCIQNGVGGAELDRLTSQEPDQLLSSALKMCDDTYFSVLYKKRTEANTIRDTAWEDSIERRESYTLDKKAVLMNSTQLYVLEGSSKTQLATNARKTGNIQGPTLSSQGGLLSSGGDSNKASLFEYCGIRPLENITKKDCKGSFHLFGASAGINDNQDMSIIRKDDVSSKDQSDVLGLNQVDSSIVKEHYAHFSELSKSPNQLNLIAKQEGTKLSKTVWSDPCNHLHDATNMDQILEKLALEFERQENLSSYSLSSCDSDLQH